MGKLFWSIASSVHKIIIMIIFSGKDKHSNEDALNANFVEPYINKARKSKKPDNSQNLTIGCFVSMIASVKDKNFSWRIYSEYEEICKILNIWKIANMVFLVDITCTKLTFLPLRATLFRPKSIITAQIHVKLIITHIIIAKVLEQPILRSNGLWIVKIELLKNQK